MKEERPDKIYFGIIAALFTIAIIYSFFIGLNDLHYAKNFSDQVFSPANQPENLSAWQTFWHIFLNNAEKAFMSLFLGIFFGVFPIYFIITNSQLIGLVSALTISFGGINILLAGLIPHGITESIAIIMASGYGLWLGVKFFRLMFFKERLEFAQALRFALMQYFRVITPLLLFSALIEAFVTPYVIHYYK